LTLLPAPCSTTSTFSIGFWMPKYTVVTSMALFDFHERIGRWPDAPKGRTRREIIALRKKLPVCRGHGTAKAGVSEEDALRRAGELPPPTFDADRRLRDLDRLE
jgi:tRNA (guanine-N7-)-methyltransferase